MLAIPLQKVVDGKVLKTHCLWVLWTRSAKRSITAVLLGGGILSITTWVTISTKALWNAWSVSTGVAPNTMPRSGSAISMLLNCKVVGLHNVMHRRSMQILTPYIVTCQPFMVHIVRPWLVLNLVTQNIAFLHILNRKQEDAQNNIRNNDTNWTI